MTVRVRLSEDPRNPRAIASQERGCGQHAARCQPMAQRAAPVRVARGRTCSPLALALALATSRCQSVSLVRVLPSARREARIPEFHNDADSCSMLAVVGRRAGMLDT